MGYIGEKTSKDNVITFDTTQWHHACLVNNNGSFTGYLDGTNVITFTNSNCLTDCTDFVVGGRGAIENATAIGAPFEGYICDVRVYGTAFTSN